MKKYILLLLLAVSYCSYSQPYQPVLGDTTQWNYYVGINLEGGMATAIFLAYGDTTVNELKYKKLYKSFAYGDQPYNNDTLLYGFIREDSTHAKLWILRNNIETKVMDLNMKVNDTIADIVIMSEAIENNVKVFCYVLSSYYPIFIEGVGNTIEPFKFFKGEINAGRSYFLCAYRDGQLIYDNTNERLNNCYMPVNIGGAVGEKLNDLFSITYKENNKILISVKSGLEQLNSLQLFGLNGVLIKSFKPESCEYTLDIAQYQQGIYILVINEKYKFKILK